MVLMRDENGHFTRGYSGNPKGRPKRADEQILVDLWQSDGQKVFTEAVKEGKQWAIKLLIDKLYPNKRESIVDADIRYESSPPMSGKEKEKLLALLS